MVLPRKGRRFRGFDAKPSTAAILEGTILAIRFYDGVRVLSREEERVLNRKAGMIAAMITLTVALGALCLCQHLGWLSP